MAVTPEQLTAARDAAINCLEIGARGSIEISSWINIEFFSDGAWGHDMFSASLIGKDALSKVINADDSLKIGRGVSSERFAEFEALMNERAAMAQEAQEALASALTEEVFSVIERLNADHLGVEFRGKNYTLHHIAAWQCANWIALLPDTMNRVLFNPLDKTTLYFDKCQKNTDGTLH